MHSESMGFTGLLFGMVPARRASGIDRIVALTETKPLSAVTHGPWVRWLSNLAHAATARFGTPRSGRALADWVFGGVEYLDP